MTDRGDDVTPPPGRLARGHDHQEWWQCYYCEALLIRSDSKGLRARAVWKCTWCGAFQVCGTSKEVRAASIAADNGKRPRRKSAMKFGVPQAPWRPKPAQSIFEPLRQRRQKDQRRAMDNLTSALDKQEKRSAAKARKNRAAAKLDRPGSSDLPAGDVLLAEYENLTSQGLGRRQANAALYKKYSQVPTETIRKKLTRARKK